MIRASLSVATPSGLIVAEGPIAPEAAVLATREGLDLRVGALNGLGDMLDVIARWPDRSGAETLSRVFTVPFVLPTPPSRLPKGLRAALHITAGQPFDASAQTT